MPIESESIRYVLYQNKKNLIELIKDFQNDRDEQNFHSLKNTMREVLNDIEIWYIELSNSFIFVK